MSHLARHCTHLCLHCWPTLPRSLLIWFPWDSQLLNRAWGILQSVRGARVQLAYLHSVWATLCTACFLALVPVPLHCTALPCGKSS